MSDRPSPLQQRLKLAAWLLISGFAVQGLTLQWAHPASFLLFILLGGILVLAGVVIYLIAIVTA